LAAIEEEEEMWHEEVVRGPERKKNTMRALTKDGDDTACRGVADGGKEWNLGWGAGEGSSPTT
jgi:hypothetical protein